MRPAVCAARSRAKTSVNSSPRSRVCATDRAAPARRQRTRRAPRPAGPSRRRGRRAAPPGPGTNARPARARTRHTHACFPSPSARARGCARISVYIRYIGFHTKRSPRNAKFPLRPAPELLFLGDQGHTTFLGCLNCSRFDDNSVCNRYGDWGSRYADRIIGNRFGDYGSRYSDSSPWNRYASKPPIIVDKDGNSGATSTTSRTWTCPEKVGAYVQ